MEKESNNLKVVFESLKHENRIRAFGEAIDERVEMDCDEYCVTADNKYAKGSIRGINFSNGLGISMMDLTFLKDTTFEFDLGNRHPVYFFFNLGDPIEIATEKENYSFHLGSSKSMICATKGEERMFLKFKAGKNIQCITVDIVRTLYLEKIDCDLDTVPAQIAEVFRDTTAEKSFYYEYKFNGLLTSSMDTLLDLDMEGLGRKAYLESKSIELFALIVRQYKKELTMNKEIFLRDRDIELIIQAQSIISKDYKNPPSISALSKQVGMNMNKLQKGFKLIYDTTIKQFIKNLRMKKAKEMLLYKDLSVSEVAHAVGYTNKGYFSKIFMETFDVLPSEMKK